MDNLRQTALRNRRAMNADKRVIASKKICKKLLATPEFLAAKLIACYLPMNDEVDTREIIARAWRANKRIFVPITRKNGEMFFREIRPNTTLVRNSMKIWEPVSGPSIAVRDLQLVVTPLVAFDDRKNRIGMGGGYYDRAFKHLRRRQHWIKPKLFGVAFNCQKAEKISPNSWDIGLYKVITEE